MDALKPISITRSKLYPAPGRSYRFAWKWLYTVDYGRAILSGGLTKADGFDTLASARRHAKQNAAPGQAIVELF